MMVTQTASKQMNEIVRKEMLGKGNRERSLNTERRLGIGSAINVGGGDSITYTVGEILWGSSLVFCAPDTSERFWPPKLELLRKPGPVPPNKRNQWFLMFLTGDERLGLSTRV